MKLTPWTATPPQRSGWYMASIERNPRARRYWNGRRWSAPCYLGDPQSHADRAFCTPAMLEPTDVIEWRGLAAPPALS